MQFIESARAWLAAVNPALPGVALVLVLWAPQAAIRRWLPGVWSWFASLGPQAQGARQLFQGLPSVVGGAVLGALSAGGDPWEAATAALVGAVAPFWHHLMKALPFVPYQGELGNKPKDDDKTPPRGGKAVLVSSALGAVVLLTASFVQTSCASAPPVDAARAVQLAFDTCELLPRLPANMQTEEAVKACDVMKRARTVCTDVIAPSVIARSPAGEPAASPADAGPGDDDTREKPADADAGAP